MLDSKIYASMSTPTKEKNETDHDMESEAGSEEENPEVFSSAPEESIDEESPKRRGRGRPPKG